MIKYIQCFVFVGNKIIYPLQKAVFWLFVSVLLVVVFCSAQTLGNDSAGSILLTKVVNIIIFTER